MSGVSDGALAVTNLKVRVMVCAIRDGSYGIDERHGLVEITKTEATLQALVDDLPVWQ